MRKLRFTLVDVFTNQPFSGNGLCVFEDGSELTGEEMQAIAREMNQAESTFILPTTQPGAAYRMRIFTPGLELPFAGHPTLGTAAVLQRAGRIPPGKLLQETRSGLTEVEVRSDLITLVAPTPSFVAAPDAHRLSQALRMQVRQAEVIQSGVRHLIVQAPSEEALAGAVPDMSALTELAREYGYIGACIFVPTPGGTTFARMRMFGPGAGIPEDPATGSAAAPFALYLYRHGLLPDGGFWYEQGVEMGRPSRLWVEATPGEDGALRVKVGGQVVQVGTGDLTM